MNTSSSLSHRKVDIVMDVITAGSFVSIILSYHLLPSLVEVLALLGLVNLLIHASIKRRNLPR
jgi:hypothetical protein